MGHVNPVRYTEPGPIAVAHRGGAGIHPENTLSAFAHAYGLGLRWLETDVRASADGVAVLHHDRTLKRLFGTEAAVADLTWDRLRSLRTPAGDRLVRPVDVLQCFPDARLAVDVKDPAVLPGLLDDVRRAGAASRVCLAGATDRVLARAAAQDPRLTTALGWRSLVSLVAAARLGTPTRVLDRRPVQAAWAHVPDRLLGAGVCTAEVVSRAGDLGIHVMAWTVDEPERMHELLDIGVRGLITDRPDVLREVLLARGQWRRPDPVRPRSDRPGAGADAMAT
jgi:glycerophosphoryl diester phosphodiesterase